ncbi:protein SAP1 [Kluyveromyces marxianus]|uniref:Protein SAP1 n=1 Tax=Kluyveromyces marxianus TaxID=4911 RepID=A0ABX6EWS6_KLUMA|nr:protein SAP1 [Kluyveromyces marxianus]BAP70506.1 protein SAP1 [Kluyveromyces marxianus]
MENHGLLMKFSKIRKKPQQPLNALAELYSRIANETIHYLDLEKKHEYKAAIQGWKIMATDAMYKLNMIDRQYPNFASYTPEELNLQSGIRDLCEKALKNLERVQSLYEDVTKMESSTNTRTPSISSNGRFKVHTLRDGVHRMRYNRGGSGLGLKSDKNTSTSNNNTVNFSASKSLPAVIVSDPFADFDDDEMNLIDLSDAETAPSAPPIPPPAPPPVPPRAPTYGHSPKSTFNISSAEIRQQDNYFDYMDISEEDLTRLKTLDSLNGTTNAFSTLSLDSSETSAQPQTPRRPSEPVPQSQRPVGITRPKKSTDNITLKSHNSPQTKKNYPVQRRNTSINAALAASNLQTNKLKSKSASSKKSAATHLTPSARSSPGTNSIPKPRATTSKSSPSLLNTATTRSNSPSKRRMGSTSSVSSANNTNTNTNNYNNNNNNASSPPPGDLQPSDQIDVVAQTKEELEDAIIDSLPGVDRTAAKQIFSEIVVHGDEVYWDDIAGLDTAKNSLKEAVVYPFLRPDLFRGLREPVRGMLLFGPPGTGKTMLARAVATESKSTFFSISASSLTSKYLGESEKLVRALFAVAKKLSPSIVFVDEIDSIMGSRNNDGENESSRRIKNEFLVQWSSLSSAAAGKGSSATDSDDRVLVLAATNLPWSIDEAARRRFVRRQYIPLPEPETRKIQLKRLLLHQRHTLSEEDFDELVCLTENYSGSDITSLAKDAAMGPLRELGDKLLFTETDKIRSVSLDDFRNSLKYIKPSVSQDGLARYEEWAAQFGSSGV